MHAPSEIDALILTQLAFGEMGHLRLVVAIRKSLGGFRKGDLSELVRSALHKLVLADAIVDTDGLYSLPRKRTAHAHA